MTRKMAAILLALMMCLSFVGCSNDGTPEGMYSATVEGEPFILYIPDEWTANTESGISGGYYSATNKIAVNARYHTPEDPNMTLDEYVTERVNGYSVSLELFDLLENGAAVLGGADAKKLVYTAKYDSTEFTFRQIFVKYQGDFVILTFYAPTEYYEENTEFFNSISDAFVLCDKAEVTNDCVTDKKTPEGMKIASADKLEYRLYVPQTWRCNSESGISEAYYPESGKPNVTVVSYSPDSAMTAEEYFAMCEEQYKKSIEGYELILTEDRTVDGKSAKAYTYGASVGGVNVRIMQTVVVYNDMVYSITYTALADSFDAHMQDVNSIINAFRFR